MIFKYAIRNLIRAPWRTILYILVVFLVILSVSSSLFVYGAARKAEKTMAEDYIFVASLVPSSSGKIFLRDIGYCTENSEVLAYNVAMSEAYGEILGGYFTADSICSHVETTISEKSKISTAIETGGKAPTMDDSEPLESNMLLNISVSEVSLAKPGVEIRYLTVLNEGEVGIVKRNYYYIGDNPGASYTDKRLLVTLIGLSDMETLGIQTHIEEEIDTENFIPVYVSKDFDRSDLKRNYVCVMPHKEDDAASIYTHGENIYGLTIPNIGSIWIVGTYENNEYFSGNDILMSVDDFYRLSIQHNITDEYFYMERMKVFEP